MPITLKSAITVPKTADNHGLFSSIISILACFQQLTVGAGSRTVFSEGWLIPTQNVIHQDF